MKLWMLDKDEVIHFMHTIGDACELNLTPNPKDTSHVMVVDDLGGFFKVMGLNQRWYRLCPHCAANFFKALDEKPRT